MVYGAHEVAARRLIEDFLRRTGATSRAAARRYLWTDAFAVCTCLALHHRIAGSTFLDAARALVEQVHHVLGRHRDDGPREGWLSGLDEADGALHPTLGGLRIGKPLPERSAGEPPDGQLEWQRDGQYYHYLTRWMHALGRMAAVTDDPEYLRHGLELAQAAHRGFVAHDAEGRPVGLHWKMSVDLSWPVIPSSGAHDPLDGLVTVEDLRHAAARHPRLAAGPDLAGVVRDLGAFCRGRSWSTDDPLGAGSLLVLLWRAAALAAVGAPVEGLSMKRLARAAVDSLDAVGGSGTFGRPAGHRLPFRELGLSLGLHALEATLTMDERARPDLGLELSGVFERWGALATDIEAFWLAPVNRDAPTWVEHEDINAVMLATSLVPEGILGGVPTYGAGERGGRRLG